MQEEPRWLLVRNYGRLLDLAQIKIINKRNYRYGNNDRAFVFVTGDARTNNQFYFGY
jgi:hypothetical protein